MSPEPSFIEESKAQSEASTILNAKIISVDVNGTPTKDYSIIISDIKKMDTSPFRYHHSHPLKFDFTVRVHTDKGDATFILNPDSSTPYQYWLYYRSKATHSYNDIGFVQTTAIDR